MKALTSGEKEWTAIDSLLRCVEHRINKGEGGIDKVKEAIYG